MVTQIYAYAGQPGAGKSTSCITAAGNLMQRGIHTALIIEDVKLDAMEFGGVSDARQVEVFHDLIRRTRLYIKLGMQVILQESSPLMAIFHMRRYGQAHLLPEVLPLFEAYKAEVQTHYLYLTRGNFDYVQHGRYQTSDEAEAFGRSQLEYLQQHYRPGEDFETFAGDDHQLMLEYMLTRLEAA